MEQLGRVISISMNVQLGHAHPTVSSGPTSATVLGSGMFGAGSPSKGTFGAASSSQGLFSATGTETIWSGGRGVDPSTAAGMLALQIGQLTWDMSVTAKVHVGHVQLVASVELCCGGTVVVGLVSSALSVGLSAAHTEQDGLVMSASK